MALHYFSFYLDKPQLLLICLPKNLQSKKTETELSEIELQQKRPQIFDPKIDLQWYKSMLTKLIVRTCIYIF